MLEAIPVAVLASMGRNHFGAVNRQPKIAQCARTRARFLAAQDAAPAYGPLRAIPTSTGSIAVELQRQPSLFFAKANDFSIRKRYPT